jgi:membrane protease YdiL (CAAX protease family)
VSIIIFALTSALGGAIGFMVSVSTNQIAPSFGLIATIKGLVVMILGGIGSLPGAIIGGLLLGVVEFQVLWFLGVTLAFLVVGPSVFADYWERQGWDIWLPVYILLTMGAFVLSRQTGVQLVGRFPFTILLFIAGFMFAWLLFQIPPLQVPLTIPVADVWSTFLFTTFVVAFGEELLFRGFLNSYVAIYSPVAAPFVSAGAWTAFHWGVYGAEPMTLLTIFAMGVGLGMAHLATRDLAGIGLTWGFHSGWNVGVAGALTVIGG